MSMISEPFDVDEFINENDNRNSTREKLLRDMKRWERYFNINIRQHDDTPGLFETILNHLLHFPSRRIRKTYPTITNDKIEQVKKLHYDLYNLNIFTNIHSHFYLILNELYNAQQKSKTTTITYDEALNIIKNYKTKNNSLYEIYSYGGRRIPALARQAHTRRQKRRIHIGSIRRITRR